MNRPDAPTTMRRMRSALATLAAATTLIGTGLATAQAEDALGRLFYTPAERQALDMQPAAGSDQATSQTTTLNGRIVRADGKMVTWTDGSIQEGTAARPLPGNGRRLEVGQSMDKATGEVRDGLKGGSIVVHRAP